MPEEPSSRTRRPDPWSSLRAAFGAALPLLTVHAALLVVWRPLLERAPAALPALFGAGCAALWLAARRLGASRTGGSPWIRGDDRSHRVQGPATRSFAGILTVAAVLRLLALPLSPGLSGDAHRYLWDGEVLLAGENPYRRAPDDPALAGLRAEWEERVGRAGPTGRERIEHPGVATVYPPLALGLFALASATPWPLLAWKLLVAAADLAGCAALLALALRLGLPMGRTVWYAWNPLVVVETAGMGHVDALGVAAAVLAALLVVRAREESSPASNRPAGARRAAAAPFGVGVAAAAGVLAKLAPLVALPLWARQSRRPWLVLGVAAALLAAAFLPVVAATGGVPPGLVAYGVSWEFDGPLYEPAWRLLAAVDADLYVKAALDRIEAWTGRFDLMDPVYPYVHPRLLAKAALALLLAVVVLRSLRDDDPVAGPGRLFGAALLASATVYPWYLLWVLPWAALALHPVWLLAAAAAPLAYLAAPVGPLGSDPFPWVWLAVWGPPAALALFPRMRRWATS